MASLMAGHLFSPMRLEKMLPDDDDDNAGPARSQQQSYHRPEGAHAQQSALNYNA